MISKRTKIGLLVFIILLGIFLGYKLLEIQNRLPYIANVEAVQLESVLTDEYLFENETVKIVAFIFTNCPDICPMTMVDLTTLQEKLKENNLFGEKVNIVTITLDPEYDTKEILQSYAENFNVDSNGWYILRGSDSETIGVTDQFQMFYKKDENGFITHSTNMYLVDRENNIRSVHDMNIGGKQVNIAELMENINRLLNE
ncbi:SCO family protein [Oceanobacillus zhaokaii]|uniref:SCO family protein n=1 Tax=Oceanobacillus zhaokaii TaxID=2052660 RepID=A0A345PJB6_9BACI|nr:SCO family protein [Oceanobacillus zhaokaii]AXI10096.1 SCO family protein [Oceanobacillus zhaokaii]